MLQKTPLFSQNDRKKNNDRISRQDKSFTAGEEDAGDDNMEDEIKIERVFDTPGKMDQKSQAGQVQEDLQISQGFDRPIHLPSLQMPHEPGEQTIVDRQESRHPAKRLHLEGDREKPRHGENGRNNTENRDPPQTREPIHTVDQLFFECIIL